MAHTARRVGPLMGKTLGDVRDRVEKGHIAQNLGLSGRAMTPQEGTDYGSECPRTMIDSTRDLLISRRERLIEEITQVEKALQLINGDQRIQELNSIVAGLDL